MNLPAAWPPAVFEAPVMRGLDEPGRQRIQAAGRMLNLGGGAAIYRQNDAGDTFFVVAQGSVTLSAVPRGYGVSTVVRVARPGDTFGEEATLRGNARRTTATAAEHVVLAEVPVPVYTRAIGRTGTGDIAAQQARLLRRQATQDLLRTMSFSCDLSPDDMGILLDSVDNRTVPRGDKVYATGDRSDHFFLIARGLVQLQTDEDGEIHVRAYLSAGDFFGDEDLLAGVNRTSSAVAVGECEVLAITGPVLRTLSDRNPSLLERIRRIATDRAAKQQEIVSTSSHTTRHVFKDLYRMQMARSLLTIDQDSCVRCGHCAWSCSQVHGVARLVRRGDKVMTRLNVLGGEEKHLMLPNSCQHCKNPACMIDCPTGAIGRDPEGEVFIREELCTGCSNCAKACPWENIRMAPRPKDSPIAASLLHSTNPGAGQSTLRLSEIATKCDLCRDYEAPACVQSCPTESIIRVDPSRDFAEVANMLGGEEGRKGGKRWRILSKIAIVASATVASIVGVLGVGLQNKGFFFPADELGVPLGWISGALMFGLLAYVLPKRLVKLWMRRRERPKGQLAGQRAEDRPATKSKVRPFYIMHIALGVLAMGAVAAHSGLRMPGNVAGALQIGFWLTALLGAFGAGVYRGIPHRLARIERKGALPEDLRRERELLGDRLYRALSGRTELVKSVAEKLLLPYAHARVGPILLLLSGHALSEEEASLRKEIEKVLQGRGVGKLAGLDDIVRICVEIRALPARRWLTFWLRVWLPGHILLTGMVMVLLVAHVVGVMGQ